MRHGRLLLCAALLLPVAACGDDTAESRDVAVTVDTAGDEQQARAMDIARRYAPDGTFTLEQETGTTVSTEGAAASRSSTVVVFAVAGDPEDVVERLEDEPHVLRVEVR